MFIIIALWSASVSLLSFGTYSFEDCKKLDFEPKACVISKLGKDVEK